MDSLFKADDDSTPLTEEETKGLKQKWVTLRSELNELEMQGILAAETWLMTNIPSDVLNEKFLRSLHKKMFESVWTWAGTFRTTERNIGVGPYLIAVKLKNLFADVHFWIYNATYPLFIHDRVDDFKNRCDFSHFFGIFAQSGSCIVNHYDLV